MTCPASLTVHPETEIPATYTPQREGTCPECGATVKLQCTDAHIDYARQTRTPRGQWIIHTHEAAS